MHAIQPNPFGGETVIRYSLPREEIVRLRVFDIQGRRVATLVDGPVPAGAYWLPWDGRGIDGRRLAEGVYIVRLQWRGGSVARKVEVIR